MARGVKTVYEFLVPSGLGGWMDTYEFSTPEAAEEARKGYPGATQVLKQFRIGR